MKSINLLPLFLIGTIAAQELATERATLIAPIVQEQVVETPSKPVLRLDVPADNIIASKDSIIDGQKITLQEVEPIALPPVLPPPPEKPITAEQIATRAAYAARAQQNRSLILSCTIYDGKHTLIHGITQTKDSVQHWEAWSNINFRHFNSHVQFNKNNINYSLHLGIDDEDTTKTAARYARFTTLNPGATDTALTKYTPPVIPELPLDATTSPRFIVTKGNPTAVDLLPIISLHEIYQEHHKELISEYQRLKEKQEREAAERLANPPDPKPDIIIQYWTVTPDAKPAPIKGGETK